MTVVSANTSNTPKQALLHSGARCLRSGVGHRRGAKAGLVGEHAAADTPRFMAADDADAQRAAHYRRRG